MQMCVLLLLLIGITVCSASIGPSTKSLMERFRLRATATLLFVFAGMLMWVREGPSVELAIVPLVGAIAFVLGSWIEHLINARLGGRCVGCSNRHSRRRRQAAAHSPACC